MGKVCLDGTVPTRWGAHKASLFVLPSAWASVHREGGEHEQPGGKAGSAGSFPLEISAGWISSLHQSSHFCWYYWKLGTPFVLVC